MVSYYSTAFAQIIIEKKVICTIYHISESRHVSSLKRKSVLLFKIKVHSVILPIPRPLDKTGLRMGTIWLTNQSFLNFAANCLFYFLSWHVAFSAKKINKNTPWGRYRSVLDLEWRWVWIDVDWDRKYHVASLFGLLHCFFISHASRAFEHKSYRVPAPIPISFWFLSFVQGCSGVQFFFLKYMDREWPWNRKKFEYLSC